MKADLHTHSTASDGQYTPAELVELAGMRGIRTLALTDHDTIDGLEEAEEAGRRIGVRVLRGVELSADDYPNLHLLGYCFTLEKLMDFFEKRKKSRNNRKYKILDFLHRKGVHLELADVERQAGEGIVGRPHFALAMVEKGIVPNRRAAFDLYLDTPEFQEFSRVNPRVDKFIKVLKEADAKVSLAHPYQIVLKGESLDHLVERLAGYGLDAIECYYPVHTPEQTSEYLRLAKKYRLHVTGGSDFHGEKHKPDHPLTAWELDLDWLIG